MPSVYLILGGNKGKSTEILSTAIDLLTNAIGQKITESSRYESESWGFQSEPFVNQIIKMETSLPPIDVLRCLQQIENQLGRTRNGSRYSDRTIDIDILYYDSLVVNDPLLSIPHPRIAARRFVLVPMAEISPDWTDPVSGMTISEMLKVCTDNSWVRKLDEY